mmetsp:Transcript_67328/g.187865  ORF Transcript_67328/g.187865 Transcript_67328/m.187865 type:complete len:248 (-) Transcript_67328:79-822(-)
MRRSRWRLKTSRLHPVGWGLQALVVHGHRLRRVVLLVHLRTPVRWAIDPLEQHVRLMGLGLHADRAANPVGDRVLRLVLPLHLAELLRSLRRVHLLSMQQLGLHPRLCGHATVRRAWSIHPLIDLPSWLHALPRRPTLMVRRPGAEIPITNRWGRERASAASHVACQHLWRRIHWSSPRALRLYMLVLGPHDCGLQLLLVRLPNLHAVAILRCEVSKRLERAEAVAQEDWHVIPKSDSIEKCCNIVA